MGLKANVAYWLRQFPFIYPKLIGSCQEWILRQGKQKGIYYSQRGPWYKELFAGDFLHNPEPQTAGVPNAKAFYNNRNYPAGKAGLFYLQNCYVLGHKGLVLTAKHEVFQEFSHHFGITTLKKFFRKNPFYTVTKNKRKVQGIGAVLISPESHNYYHWISDVLPRIKLYQQVLDQIDHFCVASNVPAKFMEVLKHFGVSESKILLVSEREKLHFDYLYVSSLPGSEGRSPQWAVDYLREKLLAPTAVTEPLKKLYFKRGDNAGRKIWNESAVITTLQQEGFVIADPGQLSIDEQVKLVQDAKIIVGAHGAALTNLLFGPDGTTAIELFSPDYFRTDCYYTLSSIRKLNYWYITGHKPQNANWGDITIDEQLLKKTLALAEKNDRKQ